MIFNFSGWKEAKSLAGDPASMGQAVLHEAIQGYTDDA